MVPIPWNSISKEGRLRNQEAYKGQRNGALVVTFWQGVRDHHVEMSQGITAEEGTDLLPWARPELNF